ncbi:MAG TPA: AbrB/MazE/SpoVT family DNA-binding domain-containing protein, partial [Nitrolancea sp.]|nr:AbrB/MazE/SpoVT family DNA-binding domain-containing protein [Nitrolancea sp.]
MSFVKVRRDGNSGVVTIPAEEMRKAHLSIGDYVQIDVEEASGRVTITPMRIEPRARHDFRKVARDVIAEERELLDRLAAYDRGEAE